MIKTGSYKHYKGGVYTVIGEAKHSETLEEMVVYTHADGEMWVRPAAMFLEEVDVDGKKVSRFTYIGD